VLTVYPVGLMLVARLMLDEEERHRRMEELRALNATLERMVDERTEELQAANEELEQTNEELMQALAEIDAASQSKSAFLRVMSHELRTPLNSVIGFADLLASGLAGPLTEEQAKQVKMIRDAGRHLLELVNQTLDLARIEAGRLDLSFDDLDARDLATSVVESLRPEADAKGLAVRTELPDEPVPLRTDPLRAREILTNLVANAV
jgi:protein-histidine pros-kinase